LILLVLAVTLGGAAYAVSLPPQYAALCHAARVGDVAAIKKLIAQGVDPNFSPKMGFFDRHTPDRPLNIAAEYAQVEAVEVLLELGADPCARGNNYDLAIERAVQGFDWNISANAEHPSVKASKDQRAEKFRKVVLLLVPKSISCDSFSVDIARSVIVTGNEALVRTYLERFKSRLNDDDIIQAVFQSAVKYKANKILNILPDILGSPADLGQCFAIARVYGNAESIKFLVSRGADPNVTYYNGKTALYYAVLYGQVKVAKALLDNGASLEVFKKEGKSPLDLAPSDEMKFLLKQYLKKTQ